ncbi:hypothetical protein CO614_04355 [Lysobacteraceae bacterium NML120232]|nr:hypothetical protein CO614_04355 [Xanthomonadaceae bacterium NML120232]
MKKLLAPILVLALAGCGFHLRRSLDLPPDLGPVRVVAPSAYSQLAESLREAVARAGAEVPESARGQKTARLEIISERWGNLPISLDASGRAQEYSLRYAVIFAMRDAEGKDIVPQQAVELSRDYLAQPTEAIGTDSETELLGKELRREMAAAILRRVDAALREQR